MSSMASVHPPARPILQRTVPRVLVIVLVVGAELHAIVGGEELVAGIIPKVKAVEGVASIPSVVISIVGHFDPEHIWDRGLSGQQVHLLIAQPEFSGVVWRQNMGYAPDFVQAAMSPFIKDIHKKGIRVISNAGGVNPLACAAALQEVVKKADLNLKIAVVTGDDLMPQKDSLHELRMADDECRKPLPKSVHSMNAYLGALPIKRCLDLGADIVVTGRCVDSAVVLGPLMHSFGWKQTSYDLLAAGSLAGHLIECGAQCTGGIFTDWHKVPDWDNMGFPVVECSADGSFVLSKPPKTGGLVSFGTVAEQLVYEIGDPQKYLLPDVTCDFSRATITEIPGVDGGAVKVEGAKGTPPSSDYKVCATYMDGYRATAVTRKIFQQLGLEDYSAVNVQVLGAEDTYGPHANKNSGPREAVVWMAVQHKQKKALELFSREIAPAGTGMGKPTWRTRLNNIIVHALTMSY
ncbi:hypothetical protein JZ751_006071 [Albula glossodonta]|uniref:Acyclic terpene utilisation N-terminal domain-containing protein n=1 Tax=Albula glossodonta TaxID=121402 RepID=A0A8T2P3T3_9TELE|nr:hypothetical protein JZ751_006071 [Albula glossodonta]